MLFDEDKHEESINRKAPKKNKDEEMDLRVGGDLE